MKKDNQIPEVSGVSIAIVYEFNQVHKTYDWYAYIINEKRVDLETVIIISEGYSETKKTATFRKQISKLAKRSPEKIELMHEALFTLNNVFKVSFFEGNKLYDKTFHFKQNTVHKNALQDIPQMEAKGILMS